MTTKRLVSVLYMPGANERALGKAAGLGCDAVILDLEDSVGPGEKKQARERVCELVRGTDFGEKTVTIRVNAADTQWHADDVRAAAAAGPDAIGVPKVDSAEAARAVCDAVRSACGAGAAPRVWAMIETPAGVLAAADIAACDELIGALVVGTNDLYAELRASATPGREAVLPHLSTCVLAARAAGVAVFDGVFNNVKDSEGFAAEAAQGAMLGFDGKTLIHPAQLEPCHAAFDPTDAEREHAQRVVDAWDSADRDGRGVATVDGRMIEAMHVDAARRVLSTPQRD